MSAFIKAIGTQAIFYLIPRTTLQRVFTLLVSSAFIVIIGLYAWYTRAFNLNLQDSWIYHRDMFRLTDPSYAEMTGYALEIFSALLFTCKAYRDRQLLWLNWTAIFIIILIDDSGRVHEAFGGLVHEDLGISRNIGEIMGFACLGLFVMSFWLLGFYQIIQRMRAELIPYLVFSLYLGLMIFFGVFVDALHVFLGRYGIVPDYLVELVEDGGELLMISLSAISTLGFYTSPTRSPNQTT